MHSNHGGDYLIIRKKLIGYDASEVMNNIQKLEEDYSMQSEKFSSEIKVLEDEISKLELEVNNTGKDERMLVELLLRKYMSLVKAIYEEDKKSEKISSEEAQKFRKLEQEYHNASEALLKYMGRVKGIIGNR